MLSILKIRLALVVVLSIGFWLNVSNECAAKAVELNLGGSQTANDATELKRDIQALKSDIEILRRDQINYRIEKDLLKDAYASQIQSINIMITLGLAFIGLVGGAFGWLGLKSLKEVKADYANELSDLRKVKADFETELEALRKNQQAVEGQIGDINRASEVQSRRLEVLEVIEKAAALMQQGQHGWALKWIDGALLLEPKNAILLSMKSGCYARVGRFRDAIEVAKQVLEIEPENIGVAKNLLEFYAITNQRSQFEQLYAMYKSDIDNDYDGALSIYLKVLADLIQGEIEVAVEKLESFLSNCAAEARKYLGTWQYDESLIALSKLPDGNQKMLLEKLIAFFDGRLSASDFQAFLKKEWPHN